VTHDLEQTAAALVDRASGDEQIEAFVMYERNVNVKAYAGEVESVSSAEPRGAGVRLFASGRVGFAFTTDLEPGGLDEVVLRARDNAAFSTPDEAVGPADAWSTAPEPVPGMASEKHDSLTPEERVAFAVDLEKETRAVDPRVRTVEEAMYADSDTRIAIATSAGITDSFRRTDAWCYTLAIVTEGEDTQVGFEFDLARTLTELNAHDVARRAVARAVGVLGAQKIPSTKLPVIFEPYTAAQFLGVIGAALTGEAVQKGRSLFAGRLGDQVASDALTLIDDGRFPGAPGSGPWDAEGVPTRRTEVITGGRLTSFLYDTKSARREGRTSTGNASRAGFKSPPHPSPSNLAFDPTGETADAILQRAGRALVVQDLHGVHSGANAISGDFSVGATGVLLDAGSPAAPVKEVTIAAPMLDILDRIVAVGDDRRWLPFGGSYGGATTLVSEMTIAGA
jgi:PmbA protein